MVEPMDAFEKELREQLQAREAPAGFTDRVMARTAARTERRRLWMPLGRWAMAGLLAAAVIAGGAEHQRRERLAGEKARAQVLLALRIAGTTLNQIQHKVQPDGPSENYQGSAGSNNEQE